MSKKVLRDLPLIERRLGTWGAKIIEPRIRRGRGGNLEVHLRCDKGEEHWMLMYRLLPNEYSVEGMKCKCHKTDNWIAGGREWKKDKDKKSRASLKAWETRRKNGQVIPWNKKQNINVAEAK